MAVDFPQPLEPTSATVLPAGTSRLKPLSTFTLGRDSYANVMSLNVTLPVSSI